MKRPNLRSYSIDGQEVFLLSITSLAKMVGVKTQTLRKWEAKKLLPKAGLLIPTKSPLSTAQGEIYKRLYTEEQAGVLAWWVAKVRPSKGLIIKASLIDMLHEKWDEADKKFKERLKRKED